jgi:hypothetical protein
VLSGAAGGAKDEDPLSGHVRHSALRTQSNQPLNLPGVSRSTQRQQRRYDSGEENKG